MSAKRLLLTLLLVGACAVVAAAAWGWSETQRSYKAFDEPVLLDHPSGAKTEELAAALARKGVVPSKWHFLAVRALRNKDILMAGEYRFAEPASPWQVFDRIVRGDVHLRQLTIPEGLNRFEISKLIGESGYATEQEFLALTADPAVVSEEFPEAQSLEGFLYPETYSLPKSADGREILAAMLENFRQAFATARAASAISRDELSPYEALTLASLIEKETGVPSERPLVSAVFHNRLERRMRLQCDPTIIYGLILEDRYHGRILDSDIADQHEYNTYEHAGLPPGPIANPGFGSLRAAFQPADSDYIFFVAEAAGEPQHVFSTSLEAHNRAVAKYRASRGGQ